MSAAVWLRNMLEAQHSSGEARRLLHVYICTSAMCQEMGGEVFTRKVVGSCGTHVSASDSALSPQLRGFASGVLASAYTATPSCLG